MFGWFKKNKEFENIKEETKKGFESVKKDVLAVSGWIKHLDSEKNMHKNDITEIKRYLTTLSRDIEEVKNTISMMNELNLNRPFKTPSRVSNKQTPVYAVQTGVQTGVQTPNLSQFSITERAIVWILLNTDMKLSYDDLASMLGKEKSTIRGQINGIKQKSELLSEKIEANGKKRVYISDEIKEKMRRSAKVRVRDTRKRKKSEED